MLGKCGHNVDESSRRLAQRFANALEAMRLFADARISVSSTVTLLLPYRELRDNR